MKNKNLVWSILTLLMTYCGIFSSNAQQANRQYPEKALGWKLGAQTYTFNRFTFTEAVSKIDSSGLRYVEAYPQQVIGGGIQEKIDHNMSESSKAYVKKLLKEKNVVWDSYGVIKARDGREWEKVFAFAKSMGVQTITCEPEARLLDSISILCDKYDMRAAIHNHAHPSYYWSPEVILSHISGKSARIGAAADIGHWMRSGLDPVECLRKLEGRVYHLHFKDLNEKGTKKAHDVHWGTGATDIPAVLKELKRQKFNGMIAAEYEYNWYNNMPDVKQSVENFRTMVQDLK